MSKRIVHSFAPVALIGGGDLGESDLDLVLKRTGMLVAADGGAVAALQAKVIPSAVIGDFDSIPSEIIEQIPADRLFIIHEQNSTDFDKALREIDAPLVLAVGFLGGRVDHQLAAFHTLVRHAHRACILIGPHEVIFHAPPVLDLDLDAGDVVSLFPLALVSGRSNGLQWPIDGLQFAPDSRIGTSNTATGPVHLSMDGPGMLVIVPRRALDAVIRAIGPGDGSVGGASDGSAGGFLPAQWPARG